MIALLVLFTVRVSLSVGVIAAIMVLSFGLVYGSVAGYFGGKVDLIMMRIVDIVYSLPDMLIIILLPVVFQERLKPLIEGTMFEKTRNQYDLHVYCVWIALLGKYGASDPWTDSYN